MKYGHCRAVEGSVDQAIEKVTQELAARGFGVLTTIDVAATLKKKINVDRRPYVILGACNPHFAHEALQREEGLGLLLPCNVVVFQDERGRTQVASINAKAMLSPVGNPDLESVAEEVTALLTEAVDAV